MIASLAELQTKLQESQQDWLMYQTNVTTSLNLVIEPLNFATVETDELVRFSGGRPYRVTCHPLRHGKTPFYGPGHIMEFEQGYLTAIADAPEHPRTDYSASL